MTRKQLILTEAALVAGALVFLYVLFGWPFGSSSASIPPADNQAFAAVNIESASGGDEHDMVAKDPGRRLPGPGECAAPPADRDFFSANQILAYYGSPYTEAMGILGQMEPEQLVSRLKEHAVEYDAANGFRGIQPALHLVSTTAQPEPGTEGKFVLHVDEDTLAEYVELACEHGLHIILDLQIGRSDLESEIRRLEPFLRQPHVQLALDPEFAMDEGEVPGRVIGSYSAAEINMAQRLLQEIADENNLPDKVLIMHQFTEEMIEGKDQIEDFTRVRLIVTMDGFGEPATKAKKFVWYAQPAEYSGIKLFFELDQPNMTPAEVVKLRPDLIIYQ